MQAASGGSGGRRQAVMAPTPVQPLFEQPTQVLVAELALGAQAPQGKAAPQPGRHFGVSRRYSGLAVMAHTELDSRLVYRLLDLLDAAHPAVRPPGGRRHHLRGAG